MGSLRREKNREPAASEPREKSREENDASVCCYGLKKEKRKKNIREKTGKEV